jgi:hypothetical protein
VSNEGFEPATVEVTVGTQPVAPLSISLAVADVQLETTVTSEPAQVGTEAGENKDSVAMSAESLGNLPIFDQDYVGAIPPALSSHPQSQAEPFLLPHRGGCAGISFVFPLPRRQ